MVLSGSLSINLPILCSKEMSGAGPCYEVLSSVKFIFDVLAAHELQFLNWLLRL